MNAFVMFFARLIAFWVRQSSDSRETRLHAQLRAW